MDRWIELQIDGYRLIGVNGQNNRQIDRRKDRWTEEKIDGQKNRQMDRGNNRQIKKRIDRWIATRINRWIEEKIYRQIAVQMDGYMKRGIDRKKKNRQMDKINEEQMERQKK